MAGFDYRWEILKSHVFIYESELSQIILELVLNGASVNIVNGYVLFLCFSDEKTPIDMERNGKILKVAIEA